MIVGDHLDQAFELLRSRLPVGWECFCAYADGQSISISVGSELFVVVGHAGSVRIDRDADAAGDVRVATDASTIVAVLDAHLGLMDAVLEDQLCVNGSAEAVAAALEALRAFIHAGVRCSGFVGLLESFRATV